MIILDTPQGSLDWITERLWRLTGSQMKKNITATGKLSASQAALENIDRLIAGIDAANEIRTNPDAIAGLDDWQVQEWIGHYTGEKFTGNAHTRRGNDLEPDALAALQERLGAQIDPVGMCIMGDDPNGVVSCSPDGLIYHEGKLNAIAEVKCPTLSTFYGWVREKRLPKEHKLQVHAAMVICEVDQAHFGAYFKGKPLFYQHVKRDAFTDILEESLHQFRVQYAQQFWEITAEAIHGEKGSPL
ncbi:MAG: YqaJ viral recombinase family protein [Acidobacteria bacterium]|nr:YqaJ viral recombinase family protein [Acidobacteriota bacterium]